MLHIEILILDFHLEGCSSLKEKRGRIRGLRDRFGKLSHVATAESDYQNEHARSQWTFIAASSDRSIVNNTLQQIEEFSNLELDAVIAHRHREVI